MAAGSRPPRPGERRPGSTGGAKRPAARPAGSGRPAGAGKPPVKRPAAKPAAKSAARPAAKGVVRGFAHGGPPGRTARSSVSYTSAQRFARRVKARRRRRALIVIAVVLLVSGLAWSALLSPWATVQRIEVTGTDRVPVAEVRAQAEAEVGQPMLLARTADIAARVSRQRLVRSVQVHRRWPGTIRVQVVERVPVAALPSGRTLALVDRDGVVIEQVRTAPAGLPRLEVGLGAEEVPALRGCLAVLEGLPAGVSRRLVAIGADSPDGIWLKVRDSKVKGDVTVEWGDSARTPKKARVLTALLVQHARGYDVRSPDRPTYVENAGSRD